MTELAFKELQNRQQGGKKGKKWQIISSLKQNLYTTKKKCKLFSLRTEMNENPYNYGEKFCVLWGVRKNKLMHIY